MRLYLMQHGKAHPGTTDPERALTPEGRAEVERVATFLRRTAPAKRGKVLHSGKTRARETAEILATADPNLDVASAPDLAPLDDPTIWANRAQALGEAVALVGHMPHLSRLASVLVTGEPEPPVVSFSNGGMVCLERSMEGDWTVRWSVIPGLLE
jgi:phosphohistidine phosphatase